MRNIESKTAYSFYKNIRNFKNVFIVKDSFLLAVLFIIAID